jgi:hypothetical protein
MLFFFIRIGGAMLVDALKFHPPCIIPKSRHVLWQRWEEILLYCMPFDIVTGENWGHFCENHGRFQD